MVGTDPARHAYRSGRPTLSRDGIAHAAATLFRQHGYRRTRLEEVALALGVTRPAIYYHFRDKQEILTEIQLRAIAGLREVAESVLEVEGLRPAERYWALLEAHIAYVVTERDFTAIVFEEEADLPDAVREEIRASRLAYTRQLCDLYVGGIADGDLPAADPLLAASTHLGAATWTYRWYRADQGRTPAEFASQVVSVLRGHPIVR